MFTAFFILKRKQNIHHSIPAEKFGVDVGKFFEVVVMRKGQDNIFLVEMDFYNVYSDFTYD